MNNDGSVALWATVPLKLTRHEDGAEIQVLGIRRRKGSCLLYGGADNGEGWELVVGDESFDVSDMPSDHLPGYTIEFPGFETYILAKLSPEVAAKVVSWRILKRDEIPVDRSFRGAWRDGKVSVDVDMPTAREIHRDHLRTLRAPLLAQLDTEYMRADEAGDKAEKARIVVQKQALRDATANPAIDAARTPEELKAIQL